MDIIEIYEGDDIDIAVGHDDIDAVKRICEKTPLNYNDIISLFIHVLIEGKLCIADYLLTLTKITRDDYKQALFQDIPDRSVEWIVSKIKFTPIWLYAYNLTRDIPGYPNFGNLPFILEHVYEE